MPRFLVRWLIHAVALYEAVAFVPGIHAQSDNWLSFLWLALIFGFLYALLRPLLKVLTCPLIILTLGVFTLAINTFLFWLAGSVGTNFGVGFTVDGLGAALWGAVVVSLVRIVLTFLFKEDSED